MTSFKTSKPTIYSTPRDVRLIDSALKEENISIAFTDTTKAITIKSVPEKEYLHIIMPMHIT